METTTYITFDKNGKGTRHKWKVQKEDFKCHSQRGAVVLNYKRIKTKKIN